MYFILGGCLTVLSVTGLAYIIDQASGFSAWLKAYVHARPRPPAEPHARTGSDDTGTYDPHIIDTIVKRRQDAD